MNKQTLAIQLPAPCYLNCSFCRTPNHGKGDLNKIKKAIKNNLTGIKEIYLTANGETGLVKGFTALVQQLLGMVDVSVLCATPHSIVPGLKRVEVSYNEHTKTEAKKAIASAKKLNIPVVISIVDEGSFKNIDLKQLADKLKVDGVVVRALQSEGLSNISAGVSRFWKRDDVDLGEFPAAAYKELSDIGKPTVCINSFGKLVPALGCG